MIRRLSLLSVLALLASCAATEIKPSLPYPAFANAEQLPDTFMAALPGIRGKQFVRDIRTRASSNRIDLPAQWRGTTGGNAEKSLEIFVLQGQLRLSDFELGPGGYAYVPAGAIGFRLESANGARLLYFLDDPAPGAVIQTPIILDSGLLDWDPIGDGISIKELRYDPGSGATTWLQLVEPGAEPRWESSASMREGYLVRGQYTHSECYEGRPATWEYLPGGYFRRPAGVLNGGPDSSATVDSVWFLREFTGGGVYEADRCVATSVEDEP